MDIVVNYFAVIVAAFVAFFAGWAWHSPLLFQRPWMRLMGYQSQQDAMGGSVAPMQAMALNAVANLVVAYVLAHFSVLFGVADYIGALTLGFWAWFGFVVPTSLNNVLWEKKSWTLYGFNIAYFLVTIEIMALIVGLWS